jgi:hypothetical protein
MVGVAALKPYPRNARRHSRRQIRKIAASIERFGFVNPVLIDENNLIIAGHGRVAAAKLLGWSGVPTLRVEHLSETEKRAYILADNRLAEDAGWDQEMLAIELQGLIELDFSIELAGFDTAEIDLVLDSRAEANAPDCNNDDEVPPIPESGNAVTRPGDRWELGRHRLLCADATIASSYEKLLGDDRASMIFTDPPYNVPIEGHVSGLGRVRHREFAMASGEMNAEQFRDFLETVFAHMAAHSRDGAIHFICMDWRHMVETLAAGDAVYSELKNLCVWAKSNGGMGTFYRSRHELVFAFKNGAAPHINNFELGQTGRYRTNLGIRWREQLRPRTRRFFSYASDGKAGGAGRRCDQGLLTATPNRPRSVRRLGHHGHCRGKDWPAGPGARAGPALLRHGRPAMAGNYR